jgi:hypothetical protein
MLPEFAHSFHERFAREGIPLLLAGGWAVCHHGYSRLTNDVDWICSRADEASAIELRELCQKYAGPDAYDLINNIP